MKNGKYELVKAPDNYPGKKYRNKYCYEHRLVWWEKHGELPGENEVIHHKNGNARDNKISNLEKINIADHNCIHRNFVTTVVLKCPNCGKVFERRKGQTHLSNKKAKATFCSKKYSGQFYGSGKKVENIGKNIIQIKKV